jgi:hypothetical protein
LREKLQQFHVLSFILSYWKREGEVSYLKSQEDQDDELQTSKAKRKNLSFQEEVSTLSRSFSTPAEGKHSRCGRKKDF